MELTEEKSWRGDYKGISYEIRFWSNKHMKSGEHSFIYPHKGIWNSYIYIHKEALGKDFKKLIPKIVDASFTPERPRQRWEYEKIDNIFNMAYGATFFEPHRDEFTGKIDAIKIGNDYNHIWNENQYITEETILLDIQKSINVFIDRFPDYLVRSVWDGTYHKPDDVAAYDEAKCESYKKKEGLK